MEVQANIQFNLSPAVVIWREGEEIRSRIFRSADLAQQFVTENSLWNNAACIHDEHGNKLACPVAPGQALQVDVP